MKITSRIVERYRKSLELYYATGNDKAIKETFDGIELVTIIGETQKYMEKCKKEKKTESVIVITSMLLVFGFTARQIATLIDVKIAACIFGGMCKILSDVNNRLPYFSENDGKEYSMICVHNYNVDYSFYDRVILRIVEVILIMDVSKFEILLLKDKKNFILLSMSNGHFQCNNSKCINEVLIHSEDRMKRAFGFYFIIEELECIKPKDDKEISRILDESISVLKKGKQEYIAELFFQYFRYKKWNKVYVVFGQMVLSSEYQKYFNECLANSSSFSLEEISSIVSFIKAIPKSDLDGERIKIQQTKKAIVTSLTNLIENKKCGTFDQKTLKGILDYLPVRMIETIRRKARKINKGLFDSELDKAIRYSLYLKDVNTAILIKEICEYNR